MIRIFVAWLLLCQGTTLMGSGMVLHVFMGDEAVRRLSSPHLRSLLESEEKAYRSGCVFPDTGYAVTEDRYGEFSHWEQFLNSYSRYLKSQCSFPFTANGQCRRLAAHFFGSLCHTIGDVNFDRYFVPQVAKQSFGGSLAKAQEFTDTGLDFVAVMEQGRGGVFTSQWAPYSDLVEIYQASGHAVSKERLIQGVSIHNLANLGIRVAAPFSWLFYRQKSPYAVEHYLTARGGVRDTALRIAEFWEETWTLLEHSRDSPEGPVFRSSGRWPEISFSVGKVNPKT